MKDSDLAKMKQVFFFSRFQPLRCKNFYLPHCYVDLNVINFAALVQNISPSIYAALQRSQKSNFCFLPPFPQKPTLAWRSACTAHVTPSSPTETLLRTPTRCSRSSSKVHFWIGWQGRA